MYKEGLTLHISDDDIENFITCPLMMQYQPEPAVRVSDTISALTNKLMIYEAKNGKKAPYSYMTRVFGVIWQKLLRDTSDKGLEKYHNTYLLLANSIYKWYLDHSLLPLASNVAINYSYGRLKYTTSIDHIVSIGGKVTAVMFVHNTTVRSEIMRNISVRAALSMVTKELSTIESAVILATNRGRLSFYTIDDIGGEFARAGERLLINLLETIGSSNFYPNFLHCNKCIAREVCINEGKRELPKAV